MADRPILFSGPMVRAILEGRKTQTRRVTVQPPPECSINYMLGNESWLPPDQRSPVRRTFEAWGGDLFRDKPKKALCGSFEIVPRIQPGDRLWVRETGHAYHWDRQRAVYRADFADGQKPCRVRTQIESYEVGRWTPGIHMPRWTSRLTLAVTDVRVQRLQEISEEDADAEVFGGQFPHVVLPELFPDADEAGRLTIVECFSRLWDSINGKRPGCAWSDNPWVAAISFETHHANIDAMPAREAA